MSVSGLKPKMASQAYEMLERQMMEITNPKQLKDQLVSLCREIQDLVRESECMDKILGRQVHALSKAENVGDTAVTQKLDLCELSWHKWLVRKRSLRSRLEL